MAECIHLLLRDAHDRLASLLPYRIRRVDTHRLDIGHPLVDDYCSSPDHQDSRPRIASTNAPPHIPSDRSPVDETPDSVAYTRLPRPRSSPAMSIASFIG